MFVCGLKVCLYVPSNLQHKYNIFFFFEKLQVLLGEIDDDKEANMPLKEVGLEEILEAQSRQQAEKEEQDRLRSKIFKERGLTYTSESIMDDAY